MINSYSSYISLRQDLTAGKVNCVQIVQHYLQHIETKNPTLNAFLEVYENEALERAKLIDQKIAEGTAGKLAGMVIGLKDVICYANHALQASSKILDSFQSQFSATVVERLLAADAIIIGRQNCDEFAMGSSNENSAFGAVCNAQDTTCVAGGSSGGSAVAVQAAMCMVSLGSDTGGSVRQPAGFCGVIGFKPTYGRVSRYGLVAYASSFDIIGILAKNIDAVALVLEVIAGGDAWDSTVSQEPIAQYSQNLAWQGKARIAYIREAIENEALSPTVRTQTEKRLADLRAAGHTVESVDFPYLKYLLPTYYVLTTAEASSNLSRFDGVRYGFRSANTKDLASLYTKSRSEGFGAEVKRRIMLGTFVLSAGFYEAYYSKAQKVRRLIQDWTKEVLKNYDFIALPTTPDVAFKIGEKRANILQMFWEDVFTVHANLAGIPAISIPNGTNEAGLPIGFQLMAGAFEEGKLLRFAKGLLERE